MGISRNFVRALDCIVPAIQTPRESIYYCIIFVGKQLKFPVNIINFDYTSWLKSLHSKFTQFNVQTKSLVCLIVLR